MKKIITSLFALVMVSQAFAQTWDFTLSATMPAGFVTWKLDGQTANANVPAAFNNAGWIIYTNSGGNHFAATTSYFVSATVPADRWLVTPRISVPTGQPNIALVWYGTSADPTYTDAYEVKISTTDSATTSFTTQVQAITEPGTPTVHMLPLASYAGQNIRVAFRDTSLNEFILIFTKIQVVNLPSYDMSAQDIQVYEHNYLTQPATVTGNIQNLGFNTVTSYTINYMANNGTVVSAPITGASIAPLAIGTYTAPAGFNPSTAGTYGLKVWATNINGNADQNPSNDTASLNTFFYAAAAGLQKKVVLEEFTGAGCPWCPGGAFTLREILAGDPHVIGVAVHSADINDLGVTPADAMQTTEGEALVTAVGSGFPTAAVDREYYYDNQGIGIGLAAYTVGSGMTSAWETEAAFRYTQATPVNVSLANKTYDTTTRALSVDVNANFLNTLSQGNYRLNLFLVEDSIITSGTGYDQDNSNYSGNTAQLPNAGALNTMPTTVVNDGLPNDWTHNHVLRKMAGGTWGTPGIIPSAPQAGSTYTNTYTVTIPSTWRAQFVSLVGVVQEYNTSVNLRTILNATEGKLLDVNTGIKTVNQLNKLEVYPNPSSTMATVEMDLKENAMVTVSIVNTLGETVTEPNTVLLNTGIHSVKMPVSSLANGLYFVKVSVDGQISSMPLSVSK